MKITTVLVMLSMMLVVKGWSTLYSYTDEKIYLHLKNNDLICLNFSVSGYDDLSSSRLKEVDLSNGQAIQTLASPPENTTLFLSNENLYGVTKEGSSNKDLCGDGSIAVIKFDEKRNEWVQDIQLNIDAISDASFYNSPTILSSPANNQSVYIYGGKCESSGDATSRMISINMSSYKASNISTSTKPQPFFGASNLLAPNPQTQLVIGGQSNGGWLNMYQLATWDFSSGWSFKQLSQTNTDQKVNSRKNALVLPIFDKIQNNSLTTVLNDLKVEGIFMIGGELLNSDSQPSYSKLSLNSNDWSWNISVEWSMDTGEIMGAATIFNTLVVVNSSSTQKRDEGYQLSLYDLSTLTSVKNLQKNYLGSTSSETRNSNTEPSVTTKAILGTVIPVSALIIGLAGTFIFKKYKRRQDQKFDEISEVDYQFGNYYENPSVLASNMNHVMPTTNQYQTHRRVMTEAENNETSSTLEVASFDSWIKKREHFDQTRDKSNRHSYLASNETLSSGTSNEDSNTLKRPGLLRPQSTSMQYPTKLMNRSVSMIKKSLSFSNAQSSTNPVYGDLNNKAKTSRVASSKVFDDEFDASEDEDVFGDSAERSTFEPMSKMNGTEKEIEEEQVSDSDLSVDDKMDVQVLVSSKRRSKLKVVNPDLHTIEDVSEPEISTRPQEDQEVDLSNMRQRIPSGAKLLDD